MKIHCVSLATDDLPRSTQFYKEWIGDQAQVDVAEDITVVWFENKTSLVLYPRKDIENHTGRQAAPSPNEHILTYFCESNDEVDQLLAKAEQLGATVTEKPTQQPWGYTCTFLDPDNHAWELNHNPNVPR